MSRLLDGVDDVLSISSVNTVLGGLFSGAGGGTLAAWINPDSVGEGGLGRIVDKRAGGTGWLWYCCNSTNPDCVGIANTITFFMDFVTTDGRWTMPENSLSLDTWQHMAVAFDASTDTTDPIFYKNGFIVATSSLLNSSGAAVSDTANNFTIGNRPAGDRTFNGKIAYLHAYKGKLLSQGEIQQIMNYPGSVRDKLVGFWPLYGFGSPEPDYSDRAFHASVTGATKGNTDPPVSGVYEPNYPQLIQVF